MGRRIQFRPGLIARRNVGHGATGLLLLSFSRPLPVVAAGVIDREQQRRSWRTQQGHSAGLSVFTLLRPWVTIRRPGRSLPEPGTSWHFDDPRCDRHCAEITGGTRIAARMATAVQRKRPARGAVELRIEPVLRATGMLSGAGADPLMAGTTANSARAIRTSLGAENPILTRPLPVLSTTISISDPIWMASPIFRERTSIFRFLSEERCAKGAEVVTSLPSAADRSTSATSLFGDGCCTQMECRAHSCRKGNRASPRPLQAARVRQMPSRW